MSTKKTVNLYIENESGGEDIVPRIVKKMKFRHLENAMGILLQVVQVLEADPALRETFSKVFTPPKEDPVDEAKLAELSDEELDKIAADKKKERDAFVLKAMFSSVQTLLTYLPAQGIALLSAISNIDKDLLYDQEIEVLYEVIDAIFEVNDVEAVIERGKQSLNVVQSSFAFLRAEKK